MRLEVTCEYTGKIGYISFSTARRKMRELTRMRKYAAEKGTFLNVYKCPTCRRFHYGNSLISRKNLSGIQVSDDEEADSYDSRRLDMDRHSFCTATGKVGHASYYEAVVRVKALLYKSNGGRKKGESIMIYLCKHCNRYHFGNQFGPKEKRRKESPESDEE